MFYRAFSVKLPYAWLFSAKLNKLIAIISTCYGFRRPTFKRLSGRLKDYLPSLHIMLLLDGLYANGPIMEQCLKKKWQFMIVLKDDSLPSVWEEFDSLIKLSPKSSSHQTWGKRRQHFRWVNQIDYHYGSKESNKITIHVVVVVVVVVVVCDEEWEEVDKNGNIVTKNSRHAWISSRPLNSNNLHDRCNLGACHRWGIEACILVEKHRGYHYEHCFALDWRALKGYHYLMRLGHVFNTLARFFLVLANAFREHGVQGFIAFIRNTLTGPWLDPEKFAHMLNKKAQLRLE